MFLIYIRKFIKNYHLWFILGLMLSLLSIYSFWPWYNWPEPFPQLALFEFKLKIIGILFLIPFIYASITFHWKGILITWSIYTTMIFFRLIDLNIHTHIIFRNLPFWFLPLAIVVFVNFEVSHIRSIKQREKLQTSYMQQVLKAQEEERQRIAHELHDGIIQDLLFAANRTKLIISKKIYLELQKLQEQVNLIENTILEASDTLRTMSVGLRPSVLDSLGLVAAIKWLIEKVLKEDQIYASVEIQGIVWKLDPVVEVTVFRIVQEALNNIRRHSQANRVKINIEFNQTTFLLKIEDNGIGFAPREFSDLISQNKMGLVGIQEKVRLINGNFDLVSEPNKGTTLRVCIKK